MRRSSIDSQSPKFSKKQLYWQQPQDLTRCQDQKIIVEFSSTNASQFKHLDLPLSDSTYPSIECSLAACNNTEKPRVRVQALIDTGIGLLSQEPGFGSFLSISKSLAQDLGMINIKVAKVQLREGTPHMEVEVRKCELQFPFSNETLIVNTIIAETGDCLMGTRLLAKVCSRFEILSQDNILRLHGLRI